METMSNIEVASSSRGNGIKLYAILAAVTLVVLLLCCKAVRIFIRRSRSEQRGQIGPQDGGPRHDLFPEEEEAPLSLKGTDGRSPGAGTSRAQSSYSGGIDGVGPMQLASIVTSRRSLAAATESCRRSAASARRSTAGTQRVSASGCRRSNTDVFSMLPSLRRSYVEDHNVHVMSKSQLVRGEMQDLQQMGGSRDGSRSLSMKSTRLDSGFFDAETTPKHKHDRATSLAIQLKWLEGQVQPGSRDGSRGSLKSTRLGNGFLDGQHVEPPEVPGRPPPALTRSAGSSGMSGGSSGLRSARPDASFFAASQAAPPPQMTRGRSAPNLSAASGGSPASQARLRGPFSSVLTRDATSPATNSSRKKSSKVKLDGPTLGRANPSESYLGTPPQSRDRAASSPWLMLRRGTIAPPRGHDGSATPDRKCSSEAHRGSAPRELFSSGQRPDGSATPTSPNGLMSRKESLVTNHL